VRFRAGLGRLTGVEVSIHLLEGGIEQFAYVAQGVRLWHKVFQAFDREQRFLHHISTAHRITPQRNSLRFTTRQAEFGFGINSTNC